MERRFSFDLYRLNIEDQSDLFMKIDSDRIRGDADIENVLRVASDSGQDQIQRTRTAVFKWSVREFVNLSIANPKRPIFHIVLARSVLEKDGQIVTDDGVSLGTSSMYPPLASTAVCLFDMSRHLVAVEHTGELSNTAWKDFFEKILTTAANSIEKYSAISLEAVPEQNGIIGIFRSFDRITRMRLTLRIPNPELTQYTRGLYDDLSKSGIREITQDMKNPNGLSKSEDARPFASAVLAEQGYKKGEVQFEGLRNGTFEQASSGNSAARGSVRGLRDFVRGLLATAKAKETQRVLAAVAAEIDKIHPIPGLNEK